MTDFTGTDLACLRGQRLVFAGLDFALPSGGALVLTGPNGNGEVQPAAPDGRADPPVSPGGSPGARPRSPTTRTPTVPASPMSAMPRR